MSNASEGQSGEDEFEGLESLVDGMPDDEPAPHGPSKGRHVWPVKEFPSNPSNPEPVAKPARESPPAPAPKASAPLPAPSTPPAAGWVDLLDADKELYGKLSAFLGAGDIERHRMVVAGRSAERQAEFYKFIVERRVHPDEHFMLAIEAVGLVNDAIQLGPSRIESAFASGIGETHQAITAAIAPLASIPAEIEQATEEFRAAKQSVGAATREFVDDAVSEMQQSLIDARAHTEDLILKFDGISIEAKNQMLGALETMMVNLMKGVDKASKDGLETARKELDALVAQSKKDLETHKHDLGLARAKAEEQLGAAVMKMVKEASDMAKVIVESNSGSKHLWKVAVVSSLATMVLMFLARHW
jgi:hypothetical protein